MMELCEFLIIGNIVLSVARPAHDPSVSVWTHPLLAWPTAWLVFWKRLSVFLFSLPPPPEPEGEGMSLDHVILHFVDKGDGQFRFRQSDPNVVLAVGRLLVAAARKAGATDA